MKYAIIFCFSLLTIGSAFGQKNDEKISKLSDKIVPNGVMNAKTIIKKKMAFLFSIALLKNVVKIIAIGKWCIAIP